MAATIADVARLAGCSITTVSRAFSVPDKVKPLTREQIYHAAQALNYSPNAIARAMVLQKNQSLAFIVGPKHYPITLNPFYAAILEAAQLEAERAGYYIYTTSLATVTEASGLLMRKRVDGVILAGQTDSNLLHYLHKQEMATVLVNNQSDLSDVVSVTSDDYAGGVQAMEHLVERGHQRIGLVTGNLFSFIVAARYQAFLDTVTRHGLSVNPSHICAVEAEQEAAYLGVKELLSQPDRPTALFCINDQIAIGAIKAALRAGMRVPEDLAVVGYDGSAVCTIIEPELTSVSVDTRSMGVLSTQSLLSMIQGERPDKCRIVLQPKLIVRQST